MKRLIALLMASTLFLTACNSGMKNEDSNKNDSKIVEDVTSIDDIDLDINPATFSDLSDENLLQYVEDEVYAGITEQLASEDYIVESVDAIIGLKGFQRIQITCNADIQHLVRMFHSNLREIHLLFQQ